MSAESREADGGDRSAAQELRALAEEHPGDFRAFAEKAEEPIRGRLLRILDEENESNGGEGE